jgi:hypothetical protein
MLMLTKNSESGGKWWEFWRVKRKTEETPSEEKPHSPVTSPQKPEELLRSPIPRIPSPIPSSPSKEPQSLPLSSLSEKRLRLARSLQLLQSDIRLAREGIETLESRLEGITLASTARQIDSDRRITLRRERGEPPPIITLPAPPQPLSLRAGTYLWLPFQRGWIIWMLWIILVLQGCLIWGLTPVSRTWEPYSFGDWGRYEKWPT